MSSNKHISLPFFGFFSLLSMSKLRGLSGKNGRVQSWMTKGTAVKAKRTGHKPAIPSSSLKPRICAERMPTKTKRMQASQKIKIKYFNFLKNEQSYKCCDYEMKRRTLRSQ